MTSEPPIRPTRDEALASLAEIDRVTIGFRKAIASGCAAPLLILWGAIWVIGFAATQYRPASAGLVWTVLDIAGIAGSFFFGAWSRGSPVKGSNHGRIFVSWLVLLVYGALWTILLIPRGLHAVGVAHSISSDLRISAFWCTVPMFGYVIMGIWIGRFLLWLGLAVTLLTLAGLIMLPGYFYLVMAIGGGGALIASGIFIRRCWR